MLGDLIEPGTVNHPRCRYEKERDGRFHLTFYRDGVLSFTFAHEGGAKGLTLQILSMTPPVADKAGYSPVNIILNRREVATRWDCGSSTYAASSFTLTPRLVKGPNLLRLSLDPTATSCWWLRSLKVEPDASQKGGRRAPRK